MKSSNKEVKISFWAAHATTVVSVTLVLILIGIIALISSGAAGETRRLREQIEISAIMADSVSNKQAAYVLTEIKSLPAVKECSLITKEQALADWKSQTGEDLEALFGVNIFSPEVSFTLKADFTDPAQLKVVEDQVAAIPGVEEVAAPDSTMVQTMNANISLLTLILGIIAIVMIVISCVLINNTVHLAVYSRRFTIHTMQLVGATNGFICRPFILSNMLAGLIAGVVASGCVAIVIATAPSYGFRLLASYVPWDMYALIATGLIVIGAGICSMAAAAATAKYLRKDYGELFK
ncbi:MAG: permease-like cell division protein FtsX [Clostridium sp.]|nr:permease-like cell division protein FtsX [Prevotella sp.]MCM1428890.1 permease-like cell division protein FtsX [Clostridium sp.]MCM1475269.1 permease-like cell division protein FtsX [Muribaculaceae bacterium]